MISSLAHEQTRVKYTRIPPAHTPPAARHESVGGEGGGGSQFTCPILKFPTHTAKDTITKLSSAFYTCDLYVHIPIINGHSYTLLFFLFFCIFLRITYRRIYEERLGEEMIREEEIWREERPGEKIRS